MSSFEQPPRPLPAEAEEPEPSRREFLAGVVAAAAAPQVAHAETVAPAESYESVRDALYEKNILELHLKALTSENEVGRIFVDDGKAARVVELPEGIDTYSVIPVDTVAELLKDPAAKLTDFHTHPQKSIARAMSIEDARGYSMQPSFQDFFMVAGFKEKFGEAADRMSYAAVDGEGVWQYGINWADPKAQEFVQILSSFETEARALVADPEIMREITPYLGAGDPRLNFLNVLQPTIFDTLSPHVQERLNNSIALLRKLEELPLFQLMSQYEVAGGVHGPEEIKALCDAYQAHGLKLSYTPYGEQEKR